jgi:hypothetical protein
MKWIKTYESGEFLRPLKRYRYDSLPKLRFSINAEIVGVATSIANIVRDSAYRRLLFTGLSSGIFTIPFRNINNVSTINL